MIAERSDCLTVEIGGARLRLVRPWRWEGGREVPATRLRVSVEAAGTGADAAAADAEVLVRLADAIALFALGGAPHRPVAARERLLAAALTYAAERGRACMLGEMSAAEAAFVLAARDLAHPLPETAASVGGRE